MMTENPYQKPIQSHWRRLRSVRWLPPFLPQCVIALALLVVITVLYLLYATIGIAAQISGMCGQLIHDAREQLEIAGPVEKSAYLVAITIYSIVFIPFWLIQTPILLLGWVSTLGWRTMSRTRMRPRQSISKLVQWGIAPR